MEYCGDCQGAPNTGVAQCASVIKKTVGLFMMRRIASDGTVNKIDLSTSSLIDLDTYLNNADPSKRWYPIMDLKNVALPKSATKYKTYNDDSKDKTASGIYSFSGILSSGQPAGLVYNLEKAGCSDMAIFGVTISGSVYGELIGTDLYPIAINAFDPAGTFATDENNAEIMVAFDLDNEFQYGRLRQMQVTNFTFSPILSKGLKNANINYVSAGTTDSVIKITNDYGAGFYDQNVHGLVIADFLLENAGVPVTITSVVEDPNVSYTLSYAAQTVADTLDLSIVINAKKYEGTASKVVA